MKTFYFNDEEYTYFKHPYNTTERNERCVEVPIVWKIVRQFQNKKILEVGNVLSHYFDVSYEIIDKCEEAKGVKNIDINDFKPEEKYDLIICVSTLEHVSENKKKLIDTFNHLKNMLEIRGKLIITFPIGQNKSLDNLLKEGRFLPIDVFYMKRFELYESWKQSSYNDVKDSQHCHPFPSGNGIAIMIFKRKV